MSTTRTPSRARESRTVASDRPIGELIRILGSDFDRLRKRMFTSANRGYVSAADAAHARSLIRSLFALIEGTTSALKMHALGEWLDRELDSSEKMQLVHYTQIVFEERTELDRHGRIVMRPRRFPIEQNLKFAFSFYSETFGVPNALDTDSKWWHASMRSQVVRDRLMHPRDPQDLDMTPKEILDALEAGHGFMHCVHAIVVKDRPTPRQTRKVKKRTG